jgi:hypothetical protein
VPVGLRALGSLVGEAELMRTFMVLLRSGQTLKVQGDLLRYEKPKSEGNAHSVVEVWVYENGAEGIITGVFELSQIHAIFEGEVTSSSE